MRLSMHQPVCLPLTYFCEPARAGKKYALVLRKGGYTVKTFDSLRQLGEFEEAFNAVGPQVQEWLLDVCITALGLLKMGNGFGEPN